MSDRFPARVPLAPSPARRRLLWTCGLANAGLALGWTGALLAQSAPIPALSWLPAVLLPAVAVASLRAARAAAPHCLLLLEPAGPAPVAPGRLHVLDKPWRLLARWLRRKSERAGSAPGAGPGAALPVISLRGARAVYAGATRLVLQDRDHRVVVWRDATDRDTFRRLAAWARWCGAGHATDAAVARATRR